MTPYYDDGRVTIYHGEACAVLADLPTGSCDVLLTDPPYSSGGMFRGDRSRPVDEKYTQPGGGGGTPLVKKSFGVFDGDSKDQRSWMLWVAAWAWDARRVCGDNGRGFVFTDWRQLPAATDALQLGGWTWRGILAWDKGQDRGLPVRGFFRQNVEFIAWGTNGAIANREDVKEFPGAVVTAPVRSDADGPKIHPTQKPSALLAHLLRVVPGDRLTALDPFMGSGSTLVAATQLGHRAVGIEVDERFCEIAANRCSQQTLDLGGVA